MSIILIDELCQLSRIRNVDEIISKQKSYSENVKKHYSKNFTNGKKITQTTIKEILQSEQKCLQYHLQYFKYYR